VSGLAGLLDDDELTDSGEGSVVTSDRAEIERLFHVKLAEVRPKELERGLTLVGPQRDDLVLSLGNLPVKGYASHGESISFALALRLASAELLRAETRSGDPVLILDDVFAELDEGRRNRLAQLIAPNEQVFITAADTADLPKQLQMIRFDVNRGVVSRSE
jgi:DNA replication and repair protein RecF